LILFQEWEKGIKENDGRGGFNYDKIKVIL
jgi:hypothetical protein